jgi:hypothetical protein
MDWNEIRHDPRHLGVRSGASKMVSDPMVRSAQNHVSILHQQKHCVQTDQNKIPRDARHQGVPSAASKMIPEPMVCLAQTVHLFRTDTNTFSKWIETGFNTTQVTYESHRVPPKRFLSLWCAWGKPFTYFVSRLALSPNRPKRASIWASSPKSTIGWAQNDSWAYGMFGESRAAILHRH